ncbi:MAG TPA: xanthine permease [Desulfobulbaceae bacterium]|nr:xanthine permease [Desulfobulbaceae bacterium]
MKYGLEDKPPPLAFLLYGLQWWVISVPCVIILGVIIARLHYPDLGSQVFYLQKLFALTGLAVLAQLFFGHRLPLVVGPAVILLVGITASVSSGVPALYTALLVGGLVLALVAAGDFLRYLQALFVPRIVAVILLLIAVTLAPTILKVSLDNGSHSAFHLAFSFGLVLIMVVLNQVLPGVWKSLTVFLGLAGGSLVYFLLSGFPDPVAYSVPETVGLLLPSLDFQAGAVVAFLFCFLALTINELGSIESVGHMLKVDDIRGRVRRGVTVCGVANMLAGAVGVVGTVSFSMSVGLIAATRCAARLTLVPAAFGLIACAFFPDVVLLLSRIPGAVMGALLLYIMAAQLASGLILLVSEHGASDFASGLTVGLPVMAAIVIVFTPAQVFTELPAFIRPIAGNGFIVGTLLALFLEHVLFRKASR